MPNEPGRKPSRPKIRLTQAEIFRIAERRLRRALKNAPPLPPNNPKKTKRRIR